MARALLTQVDAAEAISSQDPDRDPEMERFRALAAEGKPEPYTLAEYDLLMKAWAELHVGTEAEGDVRRRGDSEGRGPERTPATEDGRRRDVRGQRGVVLRRCLRLRRAGRTTRTASSRWRCSRCRAWLTSRGGRAGRLRRRWGFAAGGSVRLDSSSTVRGPLRIRR